MFITAEIGRHWKDDFKLLGDIVSRCKAAGFDAVKLQAFRESDLSSRHFKFASVTAENVSKIDEICTSRGIEWYCMPTYVEAVDFLDPYVNRYKVRYRDSEDISLLSKILSRGKPVIISCEEPKIGAETVTNLYCINKYPHTIHEIDYIKMKKFDGYSCHCPDLKSVVRAVYHDIEYLEVHVTQDLKDETLVDNAVSFPLDRCNTLISWVRGVYRMHHGKD